MISVLDPTAFDWFTWTRGVPSDIFGIPLRTSSLGIIKDIARQYAIGYCDGEQLICRPKINHKAVMFFMNGEYYWFHFRNEEFDYIFNDPGVLK
jgi:hypothetical protein